MLGDLHQGELGIVMQSDDSSGNSSVWEQGSDTNAISSPRHCTGGNAVN